MLRISRRGSGPGLQAFNRKFRFFGIWHSGRNRCSEGFRSTCSFETREGRISDQLNKALIGIVDEDQSPLSARIIDAFYPPHFLEELNHLKTAGSSPFGTPTSASLHGYKLLTRL